MTIINSLIKGKQPVIDTLNVTPTTSAQQITAPTGTDGYSPVNVSAVTSSIDANIVAGNIKKDVQILGVTGSYEGTAPTYYIEKTKDANNVLQSGSTVIDLTGVTGIGNYALYGAYYGVTFPANTSVDFSSLTTISGENACNTTFYQCSGITSVDLSGLTTISGKNACQYMFQNTTSLISINMENLTTVSGQNGCNYMFQYCSGITSINLSSLTTLSGGSSFSTAFYRCTGLTNVVLSSLKELSGNSECSNMFSNCSGLTSLSFPALTSSSFGTKTNQFNNIVSNVTGCTIHFPKNLDPTGGSTVISGLGSYPNFGGTNTVLSFDLPSTNHLIGADTVEYERSPKFDTGTALAWRVNGTAVTATIYYTSGTTDPVVNDTIYSDAACTISVTTISAIA